MFKNREVRIRLANTNKATTDETTVTDSLNPDTVKLIEETGNRIVKRVAITVVSVMAAAAVLHTLSEIAIKKTKSADNE